MKKNMQMQKDFTDYLNREVLFSCDFDRSDIGRKIKALNEKYHITEG